LDFAIAADHAGVRPWRGSGALGRGGALPNSLRTAGLRWLNRRLGWTRDTTLLCTESGSRWSNANGP